MYDRLFLQLSTIVALWFHPFVGIYCTMTAWTGFSIARLCANLSAQALCFAAFILLFASYNAMVASGMRSYAAGIATRCQMVLQIAPQLIPASI